MARVASDPSEGDCPNMGEIMQDLIKEITCPFCNKHFSDPKLMQCCHYYCKECIKSMVRALESPELPVSCPECHATTQIPGGDPDKLPSARFMSRLKSVYARVSEMTKLDVSCGRCLKEIAAAYCHKCAYFVCTGCTHTHDAKEFNGGPNVHAKKKDGGNKDKTNGKEIKSGKSKEAKQAKTTEKNKPPKKCEKHDDPIKFYCFDCDCAICYDCTLVDHKGHTFQFIKQAVVHCRQFLTDSLATLKEARKASESAMKTTGKKAEAILKKVYSNAEIVDTIQRLQTRIEDRKCELLNQVESVAQQKIDNIDAQRKSIRATSTKIEHLVKFVEDNLQSASDREFVEIHQLMIERIEEERHKLNLMKMEPPENFEGLKTDPSEYAIEISSNEAKLLEFNMEPGGCIVKGDNLETAEVNVSASLIVQTLYRKGFICVEPQEVEVELRSLVDGTRIILTGVRKKMGKYEVAYTPQIRGRHKLSVLVNGEHASESPFFIFVKIPPAKLGIPAKIINDVKLPYAVAVNSTGSVLTTQCIASEIQVLGKPDSKSEIKHSSLQYPRGIAVDKDDTIFVANTGHHCVVKLDKNGYKLGSVGGLGSDDGEFSYPMDVTVAGDRVFVCDTGNKRVQIFNRELHFLKSIKAADIELKKPCFNSLSGIASDDSGQVYVADRAVNRIHVLSNDGGFLYSFGKEGSGNLELNKPAGVCVFGEYVFVSELGNNRILIFERSGKFVVCFGVLGDVEGCLHWPFRIDVDRDGFLYVCDCLNNRVQVF